VVETEDDLSSVGSDSNDDNGSPNKKQRDELIAEL